MEREGHGKGQQLVAQRPETYPSQVMDLTEIKKGQGFVYIGAGSKPWHIKAVSNPYNDNDGSYWLDVEVDVHLQPRETSEMKTTRGKISLTDCGVIPYTSGLWNPTNRLLRA